MFVEPYRFHFHFSLLFLQMFGWITSYFEQNKKAQESE